MDQEKNQRKCVEALHLTRRIIENREYYFSNGYLNSEGMKALKIISRLIMDHCPEYMVYVKKTRKMKSYESFLKLMDVINSEES